MKGDLGAFACEVTEVSRGNESDAVFSLREAWLKDRARFWVLTVVAAANFLSCSKATCVALWVALLLLGVFIDKLL